MIRNFRIKFGSNDRELRMNTWILCLLLAIGVLVLLYFVKQKEGFANFLELNTRFTAKQDSYFQDQAGKEIYINPGLTIDGINDALYQPELDLAVSKDRDYSVYLQEDPYNGYIDRDNMCRQARYPKDMPARGPRDTSGCGWWFHSDVPSMGAYGTIDGPIKTAGLPPGGQWTWDIPTAIQREDIKLCKRIRNCDLITAEGIAGKCGFCMRLGYAVPINPNGSDKYPDSQVGACGEPTKLTPDACRPPPEPVVTNDGIDCGNYGRPSKDNTIRLYTNSECDALDGSWVPNGECLIKGGGSYSAACSGLNDPIQPSAPRTCDPGPSGALSRDCLISLASGVGFTKSGSILANLTNGTPTGDTDRQAIDMLANIGISIPDAVLSSGLTDSQTAGNTYSQIYNAISSAPKPIQREAAKWLVMGTDNFDVCNYDSGASGPFNLTCLQQQFRKAGCQASGAAYPTSANASTYAKMSWGDLSSAFKNLYKSMGSSDANTQDQATKNCLGVSYYRAAPAGQYIRTDGGYDQSSGNQQCFGPIDLESAKRKCDADPGCRSFSYSSTAGGCLKSKDHTGFQVDSNYSGYTKKGLYSAPPENKVCGVNSSDYIYCADQTIESNPQWFNVPGGLSNVSISNGKLGGANSGDGIFFADNYKNAAWVRAWGALVQVSQHKGVVVGVNRGDNIYYADNGNNAQPNWTQIPGALINVCVSNGALYGCNRQNNIYYASNYKNPQWVQIPGGLRQISADKGVVCGVNSGDGIWCYDNNNPAAPNWFNVPGALKWVSVKNGTLYGANRGDQIYYASDYRRGNWVLIPGSLKQVEQDRG